VMFQQMGFGVAVALLLDATVVRLVLVPAAMELLGERNWYLPASLRWLPDVQVAELERRPRERAARERRALAEARSYRPRPGGGGGI
jgi:uncharacterized membrane protein YdfJ with MMPL/SSD domain